MQLNAIILLDLLNIEYPLTDSKVTFCNFLATSTLVPPIDIAGQLKLNMKSADFETIWKI